MPASQAYPIGQPGRPWGENEHALWLAPQTVKRSYADDAVKGSDSLKKHHRPTSLIHQAEYFLMRPRTAAWQDYRDCMYPGALII